MTSQCPSCGTDLDVFMSIRGNYRGSPEGGDWTEQKRLSQSGSSHFEPGATASFVNELPDFLNSGIQQVRLTLANKENGSDMWRPLEIRLRRHASFDCFQGEIHHWIVDGESLVV